MDVLRSGINPFLLAIAGLAIALLMAVNKAKKNDYKYDDVGGLPNVISCVVTSFAVYLRTKTWLEGVDNLPGPQIILILLGVYAALVYALTVYKEYKMYGDNPEVIKRFKTQTILYAIIEVVIVVGFFIISFYPVR